MTPGRLDVTYDKFLTDYGTGYQQDSEEYIYKRIMPIIQAPGPVGWYRMFPKEAWLRGGAQLRAPGTESAGGEFDIDKGRYACKVFAYHYDLPLQTEAAADPDLDLQTSGTEFVVNNIELKLERLFMATYMQPKVWGGISRIEGGVTANYDFKPTVNGYGTGGDAGYFGFNGKPWNDPTANPINDVRRAAFRSLGITGRRVNTAVASADVDLALKLNVSMLSRVIQGGNPTAPADIDDQAIARLLGVKNYYVASAIYNAAQEGTQGITSFMSEGKMLLAHVPERPGKNVAAPGYIFADTTYPGAGALGLAISTIDVPLRKVRRIEGEINLDMVPVCTDLGILMTNLLG